MQKTSWLSKKSWLYCLLLVLTLIVTACGSTDVTLKKPTNHVYKENYVRSHMMSYQTIAADAIAFTAAQLQQELYGDKANIYDLNSTGGIVQQVVKYWAKSVCGLHLQNPAWTQITDAVKVCSIAAPGALQCVEFVKAVFALLGSDFELPVGGNAKDFWADYANQPAWTEVSPADITAGKGTPQLGDMVGLTNSNAKTGGDAYLYGHIGIVVAVQAPQGNQDGFVIMAGANQGGNTSAADLQLIASSNSLTVTRGNFEKITWHTAAYLSNHSGIDMFESWPDFHVQGFIRRINYYQNGSKYMVQAGSTGPGLSGAFPACNPDASGQLLQPATDPYQDPILKGLLATSTFQSTQAHTFVNESWCVAVHFQLPPQYFIIQVDDESGFDPQNRWIHASGLIQITPDDLALVGADGENGTVKTPDCIFDMKASPDCMSGSPVSLSDANSNPLHNLEVGARSMRDKLIYNLAPEGQQIDQLQEQNQHNSTFTTLNPKVQHCASINYSFSQAPDCLEGFARALVSYNGGQSVTDGYNETARKNDGSCKKFIPGQPDQWLLCVWNNQNFRDPSDSQDGNHPNNGDGVHEGARYVVNIFDYLPNHQTRCEGDNIHDLVQQVCKDDVTKYPGGMLK